jgi:hypothetical protein
MVAVTDILHDDDVQSGGQTKIPSSFLEFSKCPLDALRYSFEKIALLTMREI